MTYRISITGGGCVLLAVPTRGLPKPPLSVRPLSLDPSVGGWSRLGDHYRTHTRMGGLTEQTIGARLRCPSCPRVSPVPLLWSIPNRLHEVRFLLVLLVRLLVLVPSPTHG